jgi:hypothetical protein
MFGLSVLLIGISFSRSRLESGSIRDMFELADLFEAVSVTFDFSRSHAKIFSPERSAQRNHFNPTASDCNGTKVAYAFVASPIVARFKPM